MRYRIIAFVISVLLAASSGCGEKAQSTVVEIQLTAPGMHCNGCTSTVEETLGKMQGVDSVSADLDSKDVCVRVDTSQTSRSALEEMIARLGFADAPALDEQAPDEMAPADAPALEDEQ